MTKIEVEDLVGPCIISIASSWQLALMARKVGQARHQFKVPVPETTGDPGFVRVYRAHQNTIEFQPIFLTTLWSGSLLFHQVPVCLFGTLYLVARQKFFNGYVEDAEKRLPGFRLSIKAIQGMLLCSCLGLGNIAFEYATGKSILEYIKKLI